MHDIAHQWLDTIASDCEIMDVEQRIQCLQRNWKHSCSPTCQNAERTHLYNFLEILHLFPHCRFKKFIYEFICFL